MTSLRARIVAGFVFIVVALMVGGLATTHIQRRHLLRAVDAKIAGVVSSMSKSDRPGNALRRTSLSVMSHSDIYIGIWEDKGHQLRALSKPENDPRFIPELKGLNKDGGSQTIRVLGGETKSARAATFTLHGGGIAVVAIPLTSTNKAIARLNQTLLVVILSTMVALMLMTWWILILGIRPIRELSAAAAKVARGDSPDLSRVQTPSTEARELKTAVMSLIETSRNNEERMRRFVADASHELRTPLTTLRGYATLISSQDTQNREEMSLALERINEESIRMARLVDDLLMLTRSEEQANLSCETFDLCEVIDDIAADLKVAQPGRSITVTHPGHLSIVADRSLITQLILALGTNALRHTPESVPMSMQLGVHLDEVKVEVSDDGAGIPVDDIPHLFERFYRVNSTASRSGTGLGLAIAASIVNRHRGEIGVESEAGRGSTFWFTLPLSQQN